MKEELERLLKRVTDEGLTHEQLCFEIGKIFLDNLTVKDGVNVFVPKEEIVNHVALALKLDFSIAIEAGVFLSFNSLSLAMTTIWNKFTTTKLPPPGFATVNEIKIVSIFKLAKPLIKSDSSYDSFVSSIMEVYDNAIASATVNYLGTNGTTPMAISLPLFTIK